MRYSEPLYRPPAEADSLIIQVALGCPHNRCRFCGMYKGVPYRERDPDEILAEIAAAGKRFPETSRFFLADGDAMFLGFERLAAYLEAVNRHFPRAARIGIYANASSILRYTPEELRRLKALKLATLYLGLESGDTGVLEKVCKDAGPAEMAAAARLAQEAGLRLSVMVLLGLGGREYSRRHAAETARILNRMQPRLLSALRFIPVPGLKPFEGFSELSEYEAVQELRDLIGELALERTVFRANHTSNPLPLEGRFPADKGRLLGYLEDQLASGRLDTAGPGRRPWSM